MRYALPLLAIACSTVPHRPTYAVVEVNGPLGCDLRRMHEVFLDLDLMVDEGGVVLYRPGPDRVFPRDETLQTALESERDRLIAEDGRLGNVTLYVEDSMPLQEVVSLLDVLPSGFERVQVTSGLFPQVGPHGPRHPGDPQGSM